MHEAAFLARLRAAWRRVGTGTLQGLVAAVLALAGSAGMSLQAQAAQACPGSCATCGRCGAGAALIGAIALVTGAGRRRGLLVALGVTGLLLLGLALWLKTHGGIRTLLQRTR
ncbi:hypothetical protein [Caldinitratiruptor microaerophilus]|uniref:Transmembrane protein n=1 Tax=Caldinitratiruptor microaerophilus TaxID=671077 RepID=A0AA35CN11_9FIRM|nr:hypothetical protein [Caldinitratiruptor microaerophilus]BDG62192.1 hypothetical protein caldi_32820 [Caldinitratiruptor microaerophilus]